MNWFEHEYPYTNFHELNLDWVIRTVKKLFGDLETFKHLNSLTFADPILWNITTQYTKGTIVLNSTGDAYISKEAVPSGIQLDNTDYWEEIFNFADYVRTANSNLTFNVEIATERASKSYEEDDWLLWNDVLYKVTTDIPSDDLLEVGTNIVHFTVEDFCRAWQTYMINTINQYKNDIDASELAYKNEINGIVTQYKNDIDASELAYKNEIDASELAYKNQLDASVTTTTSSLQAQLNEAIAGATVDSEVINGRIGVNSITYDTIGDAIRYQVTTLAQHINDLALSIGRVLQSNDFEAKRYNIDGTYTDPYTVRACCKYTGINKNSDIFWDASLWQLNYYVVDSDNVNIYTPNAWNSTGHIKFTHSDNANVILQLRRANETNLVGDLPLMNERVFLFNNTGSEFYHGVISGTRLEDNNLEGYYSVGGYNASPTADMVDMPVSDFSGGLLINTLVGNYGNAHLQILIEIPTTYSIGRKFSRVNYGTWKITQDIKWVAYGDSITYGTYSIDSSTTQSSHDKSYINYIAKVLKRDCVLSVNNCAVRGIGWLDTGNNNETLDDMFDLFTGTKSDINLVTIMLGINDYLTHNDPLGDETATEKDGTISGNIRYGIRWLCENFPDAKIVVISPINSTMYGSINSAWSRHTLLNNPKSLQDLSDMVEYWCNYFGVKFINELSAGVVNTYNAESILLDGLHPSETGHVMLAHDIGNQLDI